MKRLGPLALVVLIVGLSLGGATGCATGTVDTAYGPRPAAEVQAQDAVADVLQSLEDGYRLAVLQHDARVATDDPAQHAANRALLIKEHDALVASASALVQWKKTAGSGITPAGVIQPLIESLPAYLKLAVSLGAMTQDAADKVLAYAKALFPTMVTGARPYVGRTPDGSTVMLYPVGGIR